MFFFSFFFSVENLQAVIGCSGTRDVFFCSEQIQQQDAGDCFVAEFFQVYIVFLVVAILLKQIAIRLQIY